VVGFIALACHGGTIIVQSIIHDLVKSLSQPETRISQQLVSALSFHTFQDC